MPNENKLIEPMIFDEDRNTQSEIIAPNKHGLINPMEFDVRTKSVEEKIYIILYKVDHIDEMDQMYRNIYDICLGRTDAYNTIKEKLVSGVPIDIHRTKIITETKQTETDSGDRKYYLLPYNECISLYAFLLSIQDFYSEDNFDIEDYNTTGIPEDVKDDIEDKPNYLTPEQVEYRKMLEASMHRDKFLNTMKNEGTNI